ncbi:MAG: Unknown protein [uncultured Sulfurovum sp.]|uniref:Cytochrome c domain-containing protein n=1 Tax=uncultured Sulfurovum sp. TaxID=269237 RepID=A0A6S6T443_9BACT|nr:MAG: Unknown protein [uncultured Sulfurovum sp.]
MRKILLLLITTLALVANSQELYKNCAGCHGENGEIQALSKSAIIGGQDKNLTIKQLTAYKNSELNKYGLGNIMNLQLSTFSDQDINKLANYIATMDTNASSK